MKFLLVTLFSVLAVVIAAPENSPKFNPQQHEVFDQFFEMFNDHLDDNFSKVFKEAAEAICEKKDTDFEGPFEETAKRFEEIFEKDYGSQTVCSFFGKAVFYVTEPMAKAIDGCVASEVTGIADFFIKAFVSGYGQFCSFTGEQIFELVHPCLADLELEESECFKKAAFNETIGGSFKQEFCRGYKEVRPCFEEGVKTKCKLPITQEAVLTFLDSAFQKPCFA